MTEVLLVIEASSVVLSIFLPSAFFCSMPISSMNAPRVPDPSSREMTAMLFAASKLDAAEDGATEEGAAEGEGVVDELAVLAPQPANAVSAIAEIKAAEIIFFILNKLLYSFCSFILWIVFSLKNKRKV